MSLYCHSVSLNILSLCLTLLLTIRHTRLSCLFKPYQIERAKRMSDAREKKKYKGVPDSKLKKFLKAMTLSAKYDNKKGNLIDCICNIIAEGKYVFDLAQWVDSGNPLSPKERALVIRLRGAPDPANKLMLGEVMFDFVVNYKMDGEKLNKRNSANSRKHKVKRTVWDYEYELISINTATCTLFGFFKQNAIEFSSTEFRGSKYIVYDRRFDVILFLKKKYLFFLSHPIIRGQVLCVLSSSLERSAYTPSDVWHE
jgi:hypothetical protein